MNTHKLVPVEPTPEMLKAEPPKLVASGHTEEEILMCQHVLIELAAADLANLDTGVIELCGEDDQGREGCTEVNFQEYAAKAAAILGSVVAAQEAEQEPFGYTCEREINRYMRGASTKFHILKGCGDSYEYRVPLYLQPHPLSSASRLASLFNQNSPDGRRLTGKLDDFIDDLNATLSSNWKQGGEP